MYLTTFSNSNDNSEDEENSPEGEENSKYFDLEMLYMYNTSDNLYTL